MAMIEVSAKILEKLADRLNELDVKARTHYKKDFQVNTICLDLESDIAGLAYPEEPLIRLNPVYLVENTEEFLHDTVAHEYAHRIAYELYGPKISEHGLEWKGVMAVFGVKPNVTSSYDDKTIRKHLRAA